MRLALARAAHSGWVLQIFGYEPSVEQTAQARLGIRLFFGPVALLIWYPTILWGPSESRRKLKGIVEDLSPRKVYQGLAKTSIKVQGLVFDFNGVLWWDNHLQEGAWKRFSSEIRGAPLTDKENAIHVHGRNNRHTLEYLTGRTVRGDELRQLTQQKERIYRRLCLDRGHDFALSPGAIELLDFLATRRIYHTIATASEKTNLDFFVEHLNLDRWFDIGTIVYDDGTRQGKPAPDIYLQAAGNLGLEPAACVVVEDSRSGIQAAHNAGIAHIIALGPARTHDQLALLEGVGEVIVSLEQFPRERLFR